MSRTEHTAGHVEVLLEALRARGIPLPKSKPAKIESLTELVAAGPLQAEGIVDLGKRRAKFAVSLGPQFGAITMAQVGDALRAAIGFDLVVFAGFAVSADAQEKLGSGKIGATDVALLLANPDLLVGDLLKNTKASQTFRLYRVARRKNRERRRRIPCTSGRRGLLRRCDGRCDVLREDRNPGVVLG